MTGASRRLMGATPILLGVLLFLGLLLRLVWVPWPGQGDILLIGNWSKFAALHGIADVYDPQLYADYAQAEGITGYLATPTIYPPLLMDALALVGVVYRLLTPTFDVTAPAFLYAIRAPALLADLMTGLLIFLVVGRRTTDRFGLLAAAVYLFNPAIAYTSGYAGHFDSVYTFFLLLALLAAVGRRPGWAGACFALAVLTKLQAGALLPILAITVLHLGGWRGMLRTVTGGFAATAIVLAPYLVTGALSDLVGAVIDSFGYYPYLAVGALNFWQVIATLGWGTFHARFPDFTVLELGLTPRLLGLLMLGAITGLLSLSLWRRPEPSRAFVAAALQVFAFFLVATEMHERYLFPALPLLAVNLGRRLPTGLYVSLSVTYFINLYVLFWSWQAAGYALWLSGLTIPLVAVANCVLFALGLWLFLRSERSKRPREVPADGLPPLLTVNDGGPGR